MSKRILAGLFAFTVLLPTAVAAAENRPPKTMLKAGDVKQEGMRGDFCWGADAGQVGCTGPLDYDWPRAVRTETGILVRIRIRRNDKPDDLDLTYWREVGEDGQPVEPGQQFEYRLVQRERDSGAVWDVRFRLPEEPGHLYLDMTGRWRDKNDGGEASYWFHLRLEQPPE